MSGPTKPGDPHYPRGSGRTWNQLKACVGLVLLDARSTIYVVHTEPGYCMNMVLMIMRTEFPNTGVQFNVNAARRRIEFSNGAWIQFRVAKHVGEQLRADEEARRTRAEIVYDHAS